MAGVGCDVGVVVRFPSMNKPKLTYFDAPVSRGEECRLALHLAGIDFEDARINAAAWPAMKEQTPYGGLPVLELPGEPPLAHSNAILVLIGRRHGLHPADDFEAARHEGMMQHVEDLRAVVSPTNRMGDAEKRAARETIVAGFLPAWATSRGKEHPRRAVLRRREAPRRGPQTPHGGALVHRRQGRPHSRNDIRRLPQAHGGVRRRARPSWREIVVREGLSHVRKGACAATLPGVKLIGSRRTRALTGERFELRTLTSALGPSREDFVCWTETGCRISQSK